MPGGPDISMFLQPRDQGVLNTPCSGLVSGALRAKGSYELFFGFRPEFSHNPDNAGAGSLAWHGALWNNSSYKLFFGFMPEYLHNSDNISKAK